jgi:hypothetical protein
MFSAFSITLACGKFVLAASRLPSMDALSTTMTSVEPASRLSKTDFRQDKRSSLVL